ncbi:hypothetical protein JM658_05245 [Joostella atrarenae]|uniref:Uncharacterized protein n=1 Tax=Joostella atrarenae TaxID=679257 RepID=A0ABS9J1D0_9FLAO|nr:hypothetical protein [Joostella atrarenae]MCF8714229.1 hypothetical protein [Joostella atrarenae]
MKRETSYLDIHNKIKLKTSYSLERILNLIEEEDISASEELYSFLKDIEDVLRKNKIADYTHIAAHRIEVLGFNTAIDQRIPLKKYQLERASALIPTITETLSNALKPIEERINTSRIIIKELILKAYEEEIINYEENTNHADHINKIWHSLLNHKILNKKANEISLSLNKLDILTLLSEEINTNKMIS